MGGAAVVACSGNDGATGASGLSGDAGSNGSPGPAGSAGATGATGPAGEAGATGPAGEAGAVIILSESAKKGLDISPVKLNLTGLTGDQLEMVGNGSYLVNAAGDCTGCHTSDPTKFLGGGVPFVDPGSVGDAGTDPGFTVYSRNLTPDPTTGLKLTEDQFVAAIRTGADFHDAGDAGPTRSLIVMPWDSYRWMSTYDIKSIYAYLKTIPAASNQVMNDAKQAFPPGPAPTAYTAGDAVSVDGGQGSVPLPDDTMPDPGNVLRGLAISPFSSEPRIVPTDPAAASLYARGSYIVNSIADCSGCHTNRDLPTGKILTSRYLTGGQIFPIPDPAQKPTGFVRVVTANLTGDKHGYFNENPSFATFLAVITQGVHAEMPAPQMPIAPPMPVENLKHLSLGDLEAIYTYVSTVAGTYGASNYGGTVDKVYPANALYCDTTVQCPSSMSCSSATGSGECVNKTCAVDSDCAVCQVCTTGACKTQTGTALSACEGAGF